MAARPSATKSALLTAFEEQQLPVPIGLPKLRDKTEAGLGRQHEQGGLEGGAAVLQGGQVPAGTAQSPRPPRCRLQHSVHGHALS